ncbi:hypothetical protein cypCar_00033561 [Cyprinus carpio]|nr:hypothetical protein cypCar_00033561 [Cyprinus carpio]
MSFIKEESEDARIDEVFKHEETETRAGVPCIKVLPVSCLTSQSCNKDFATTTAPLVTTIGMSNADSLVDSAFGKVQAASVLL